MPSPSPSSTHHITLRAISQYLNNSVQYHIIENVYMHIKEKMKTWDIDQEATEEDSAEGAVEVMGMEQDTLIMRVTLLDV